MTNMRKEKKQFSDGKDKRTRSMCLKLAVSGKIYHVKFICCRNTLIAISTVVMDQLMSMIFSNEGNGRDYAFRL